MKSVALVPVGARKRSFAILLTAVLGGCASLPPGADFPKVASAALAHPETTRLGDQFAIAAREHGGLSGFRIITVGVDGFLARAQMIDAAERTLDLQYFIFRGDETGRLLTDALLRAADRGVRVRVLVDDGDTVAGDEQILALARAIRASRSGSSIRSPIAAIINCCGALEFMFHSSRLDYRMHNKLLVVDNSVALIGGRNIGNQYFQIDPESQFADYDVFSAGPIVEQLSATFDEFWNSRFAIPAELNERQTTRRDPFGARASARASRAAVASLADRRNRLREADCDRRALRRDDLRSPAARLGTGAASLR